MTINRWVTIDLSDVTVLRGHRDVAGREDGRACPAWQERFFAVMEARLCRSDFFTCPTIIVEVGAARFRFRLHT